MIFQSENEKKLSFVWESKLNSLYKRFVFSAQLLCFAYYMWTKILIFCLIKVHYKHLKIKSALSHL